MAKKKMAKSRKIDLSSDAWIGDVMSLSPKQIQMIKDRVNKVTRTKWWSKSTRNRKPQKRKKSEILADMDDKEIRGWLFSSDDAND